MEAFNKKEHWENIYQTKELTEVSWYQPNPSTSLQLVTDYAKSHESRIIDIGGGDSFLVDKLIELGYRNLTVLDISEKAIDRAKKRLGEKAQFVNWIIADVTNFETNEKYDLWHDRAAFHFLTQKSEIDTYISTARERLNEDGILVIGTFSDKGPKKCSGIEIQQYTEETMSDKFESDFDKLQCLTIDHTTPFQTIQNFLFCCFKKK